MTTQDSDVVIQYYTDETREVKRTIGAYGNTCTFVKTIVENKNGNWDNKGFDIKDGFAVLHKGKYHDVYAIPNDHTEARKKRD